ncbi:MAG: hypothetical protein DRO88_00710 [Promethearchaeia archaeon]|nr:MAG: hypothetical protein DRO88_00710 [Candidatus Lokiarchaeia archaeon]
MLNQLNFYFHQGRTAIAKSLLTLFAIGLGVSLISGVNFYLDSYQTQALEESFYNLFDYGVEKSRVSNPLDDFLSLEKQEKLTSLLQDNNLAPENMFPMIEYYCYHISAYSIEDEEWSPQFIFSTPDFYQSSSFQDYFYIYSGTYPNSENSILISDELARYFNLTIGSTFSIHFNSSSYHSNIYNSTFNSYLNMTLAGTYMPKYQDFKMGDYNLWWSSYFDTEIQQKVSTSRAFWIEDQNLIFGCLNQSESGILFSNHPFYKLEHYWYEQNQKLNSTSQFYVSRYDLGIYGEIDKSKMSYRNIISFKRQLENNFAIFLSNYESFYLENGKPAFRLYLLRALESFTQEILGMRIILQIFNVPIILSAFYIGNFSIRLNTKERQREFLLLRSKGIPRKMVRRQFIMQSLMIGLIGGTIGFFGGIGLFHILKPLFSVFFENSLTRSIPLRISLYSVIYTYASSIILLLISSIPSIRFINKKETNQLLSTIGADSLDVEYDERTLFQKKKKDGIELEDTPFLRQNAVKKEKSTFKILWNQRFQNKKKRNRTKVYQNQIRKKERKIHKIGIYFIIFSLIPLFAYFLVILSNLPFAPNGLIIFVEETLLPNFSTLYLFSVFSPVLLVLGFIRFFTKENPSRFAHLVKKLAYPFVKKKNFIVSLQMVKQQAYIQFMIICGLFCSLLVFSNIALYSMQAYETINDNLQVGGDVNFRINDNAYYLHNRSVPVSLSEIITRENQIITQKDENNQSFINNVVTSFQITSYSWGNDINRRNLYFIDVVKYLSAITEDDKLIPNKEFSHKIEAINRYFSNSSQNYPGMVVNPSFLHIHNKEVGDIVNIPLYYYNYTDEELCSITYTVKIVESLPFFPGMAPNYYYYSQNEVILNLSLLPTDFGPMFLDFDSGYSGDSSISYQYYEINQILDVDSTQLKNSSHLLYLLQQIQFNWFDPSYFNIYNPNLFVEIGSGSISPFDDTILYFYEIIQLEFFIIGGILALTLALITLGIQRQNKFENGVFLSRGMGWKGLLKLILTQISIVFIIALGFGILGGYISGLVLMQIFQRTELSYQNINLPIYAKTLDIVWMLCSIIGLTFVVYLISFYFETKRNIREYLPEF